MPSGLTDKIDKGASFPEFALLCARQFGGLIHMRDESLDAKITLPNNTAYYEEQLKKEEGRLKELQKINLTDYEKEALLKRENSLKEAKENIDRKGKLKGKYMHMLMEVKAWRPPSEEHKELKSYMTKQITDSISFDCGTEYDDKVIQEFAQPLDVQKTFNEEVERTQQSIEYYKEKLAGEQERNSSRTKWVKDLVHSLMMTPEQKEKILDFDV